MRTAGGMTARTGLSALRGQRNTMKGDDFFAMVAQRPPFTRLHPKVAAFFKTYLAHEKVVSFGDRYVANMNFPPYPGPAFESMAEEFSRIGETNRLYSVTLAVTNRCGYQCWHCYNAGRCQTDTPLPALARLARELQDRGAVMVTLTGGEPLLREDLEEIARQFDPRSCLVLGTTGDGLTAARARRLQRAGIFAVGISLDSQDETEHDRWRGRPGAFRTALTALRLARENGLYAYVVSVATRDFLQRARFLSFMRFVAAAGALEVHLLEPSATGKLAGQTGVLLTAAEQRRMTVCPSCPRFLTWNQRKLSVAERA
ncbi:MAG: radical SAM protein [Verrucomicrobia bacterium]|nr:radical SAM protein [Verrucomicrobiota bacterium]